MVSLLERKLLRDLGRRRWQFVAIVATVFLGVGLFGASYDAYNNLTASYQALFDRTGFAALTAEGGDPDTVAAALRAADGVSAVETRRVADLPFRVGERTFVGRLVGMPSGRRPAVNDVLFLSGQRPAADQADGVVIERHMADSFDLASGDTFEVRTPDGWQTVTVTGVAASPEYVWPARSRQEVFTLPDQFGVAFGARELVAGLPLQLVTSQVLVRTGAPADDPDVLARLRQVALAAGASDTFTRAEQPSNATLNEDIQGFGELSVLFPVMFLAAAGIATYVLLSRLILSQRQQVGLLLAVGFSRRRVFAHYLGFGLLIGLVGSVLGALAGLLLAGLITRVYTGVIGIPVAVVEIRPLTIMAGVVFGLVAGALSALVPAIRASRMSPAEAMSATIGTGVGARSMVERAFPALGRLPARWRMVVRGVGRSRVRSMTTIGGVMMAVTLVFVSWAMIDTVGFLIDRQFAGAERQDATLALPGSVSEASLARIEDVAGVAQAEPVTHLSVTLVNRDRRYSTTLAGLPVGTQMHRFLAAQPLALGHGLLVGSALREQLDLGVGDSVRLTFPQLGIDGTATVAGFVDEPLGTFAYLSRGELSGLIGRSAVQEATREVDVRFEPAADRPATLARLSDLDGIAAVVDARALQRSAESLMGLFYAFVGLMLALGAVMAFAVLFNLMAANIGERVTELAALRAAGMRGPELSRMITAENVLLTVAGILPGLVVGYLAALEFMASFSSDLFSFELHVQPMTFVFTAAGILLAAIVSQAPVLRTVRRIEIATVVRERAV